MFKNFLARPLYGRQDWQAMMRFVLPFAPAKVPLLNIETRINLKVPQNESSTNSRFVKKT
jgi:hypothetical protein